MTLVLLAVLGIGAVTALAYQARAVMYRYPMDYGEAPLVDQAMRLSAGENIYRADLSIPPYVVANYPPIYMTTLVPFVKIFGPSFHAGRAISVIAAWVSAVLLALIVARQTRDGVAGLVTGLLFITLPFVVGWSSLLRIDLLALALSLAGLFLVIPQPLTRSRLIGAAILLVGAVYTRQQYGLAAPLAAAVCVWTQNRRDAFTLAGVVGALGLLVFVTLNTLTSGGFYFNIVTANVNVFDVAWLSFNVQRLRATALVLLCFAAASLVLWRWRTPFSLTTAMYVVGAAMSALTVGKIGSNVNYFLELLAASTLATGSVLAWSRQRVAAPIVRMVLLSLLILHSLAAARITLDLHRVQLQPRLDAADDLRRLEMMVAETNGPILADEYMGLLVLQRRALIFQPFEMTQLARANLWDQSNLVRRIRNREFALILLHRFAATPVHLDRWTSEMLEALDESYSTTAVIARTAVYKPARHRAGDATTRF